MTASAPEGERSMSSPMAIPGILVLLGVVLVLLGFVQTNQTFIIVGAVVAIAGGGFGVISSRGGTSR